MQGLGHHGKACTPSGDGIGKWTWTIPATTGTPPCIPATLLTYPLGARSSVAARIPYAFIRAICVPLTRANTKQFRQKQHSPCLVRPGSMQATVLRPVAHFYLGAHGRYKQLHKTAATPPNNTIAAPHMHARCTSQDTKLRTSLPSVIHSSPSLPVALAPGCPRRPGQPDSRQGRHH